MNPRTTLLVIAALTLPLFALEKPEGDDIPKFIQSSVSMDAKQVAAKKRTTNDFRTDYGSYDKTFERFRTLEVSFRNFGRADFEGQYCVWWLGRKGPGGGERVVYEYPKEQAVQLKVGELKKIEVESPSIEATDLRLRAIGVRRTGGFKLEGWMIVFYDKEFRPIAVRASAGAIEDEYRKGFMPQWPLFKE